MKNQVTKRVSQPLVLVFTLVLAMLAFAAAPALATGPRWKVELSSAPRNLPPGSEAEVSVIASNVGREPVRVLAPSSPVKLDIHLPAGLSAVGLAHEPFVGYLGRQGDENGLLLENTMTCNVVSGGLVQCEWTGARDLPPHEAIELRLFVDVAANAQTGEEDEVTVEGGDTPAAVTRSALVISDQPTPFGVEHYELTPENEDGTLDTQAGSHPYSLTSTINFNSTLEQNQKYGLLPTTPALTRDLHFELPAGLVGNPTPFPQCTEEQFDTKGHNGTNVCPPEAAVGVASVSLNDPGEKGAFTVLVPLFNVTPGPGEPARFGFQIESVPVFLDTSVRTGGDYGVTVNVENTNQLSDLISSRVTFWGVPGAPSHDAERGWGCIDLEFSASDLPCSKLELPEQPLLTLPTSCTGPLETSVEGNSWPTTGNPAGLTLPTTKPLFMENLDGCNRLGFEPEIKVAPDVESSSSPSGLTVDVHVPQEGQLNPAGLADSNINDIAVTLPEGVSINPAGADGLEACSEPEIGYLPGESAPPGELHFTSGLPAPKGAPAEPFCPDASKIGTVKIKTPLLPNPLEGAVYLADQNANPFGSLVASYIVAEDPVSGVLLKLPGEVSLNQQSGQITATFLDNPQDPLEDAELHFFGGERAPLATPAHCGTYTTNATFTPWSGNGPVRSQSSFNIKTGPNGSACPGAALPFSPSLAAGMTNIQAGAFSSFTMTMSREDGQQNLRSIELHMPPGLSGVLTGVPLCGEAQADAGTCPAASLIGETTVSVGLGSDPFTVKGGQVFLTGPYKGAPFGLSIVNPAVAGPFNLGKVIVRAKLEIDPHTAAVTVTSDSSGPYAIPPSIDGIPLEIKHVNVTVNRGGGQGDFTFNPTNCGPLAITGRLQSIEGGAQSLAVPFQATNCAVLKFAPKFAVSTKGKTSKANGASLSVKLTYPETPQGTEANIKAVKVDLPKQLPSRLTTLQKACTAAQFEANPAGCPAASIIGHAKAVTPLIPVPLEGPAYFVSHGGEAFPSLIVVLQGYGVTVDLVGTTFISKAGITSSTFKTVPDVPVGTFELTLPQGKFSALAANLPAKAKGSFCGQALAMPTAFVAQNGVEIHESTKISVTGCAKTKPLAKTLKAQQLAVALKACHKKVKGKRGSCEKAARKHYGSAKKVKK
jgi:hypothetical protein